MPGVHRHSTLFKEHSWSPPFVSGIREWHPIQDGTFSRTRTGHESPLVAISIHAITIRMEQAKVIFMQFAYT